MSTATQVREVPYEGPHAGYGTKKVLWSGRIISDIVVLFTVFDGISKVVKESHVMQASAQLGFSVDAIEGIGIALLLCTLAYAIPRTAILGAILLTGYLGGAVASQVRIGSPWSQTLLPVVFAVLVWAGVFLRDSRLRTLLPVRK